MKITQNFSLLKTLIILATLVLALVSCENTKVEPTLDDVFSVLQAELVSEEFPDSRGSDANRPVVANVQGNGSVIAGGSNLMRVSYNDPQGDITSLLIGMEGEDGHYKMPASGTEKPVTPSA